MAIYRHEQARLSFASEAGQGGYFEVIDTTTDAANWTAAVNMADDLPAGSRSVIFDTGTGGTLAVGAYVLLGTAGEWNAEIRRIISLGTYDGSGAAGTVFFDYPTGFWHNDSETLLEKSNATPTGSNYTVQTTGGHPLGTAGDGGINFASFLPGVYETITTPDLTPELLPQYFLKDNSDRNWSYIYRGKQTFNGALPNVLLLNGFPLKYGFGQVATTSSTSGGAGAGVLLAATLVGDRELTLDGASGANYIAGDYIQVDVGNLAEVREILVIATDTLTLNYPMLMAHAAAVVCAEVIAPFTHTILESGELPTMTWNVLMRDSDETAANDFIRRYVGGMVNRATLSADEGEMLRYSWDDVQFLDLVHNQVRSTGVTGDSATADVVENSSSMLLSPIAIGTAMPNAAGLLGSPTWPANEPYYFSQGCLTFFGVEFARVRNFSLEVNNNIEPRYYIKNTGGKRIAGEFQELNREYRMTVTLALPNSVTADPAVAASATRSLWKELILEGNYGGYTSQEALTGFDLTLEFTRGANDLIRVTSPSSAASNAFNSQGCFFTRATHSIGTDSPIQVDGEILMHDILLVAIDSDAVYP